MDDRLSHATVSRTTNTVLQEVRAWQSRRLGPVCAAVFLDAIMVKVRYDHVVQSKAACLAVGIDVNGKSTCWASGSGWSRPRPRPRPPGRTPGSELMREAL